MVTHRKEGQDLLFLTVVSRRERASREVKVTLRTILTRFPHCKMYSSFDHYINK